MSFIANTGHTRWGASIAGTPREAGRTPAYLPERDQVVVGHESGQFGVFDDADIGEEVGFGEAVSAEVRGRHEDGSDVSLELRKITWEVGRVGLGPVAERHAHRFLGSIGVVDCGSAKQDGHRSGLFTLEHVRDPDDRVVLLLCCGPIPLVANAQT